MGLIGGDVVTGIARGYAVLEPHGAAKPLTAVFGKAAVCCAVAAVGLVRQEVVTARRIGALIAGRRATAYTTKTLAAGEAGFAIRAAMGFIG